MAIERGAWGSRAGFILAAAGSAVGLGNIWGFPTQVGQGGGAAFVLVYLLCVAFIWAAIMLGGVRSGIERATKILMPLLFLLLILLAVRAATLPGAEAGLSYYVRP